MRKVLIVCLLILLIFCCYYTLQNGIHIGNLKINSIQELKNENEKLESTITTIGELSNKTFEQKKSELTKSTKDLLNSKEEYEQLTSISSESQINLSSQLESYKIEYLLAKIGTHATKEGIIIKMDVKTAANGATDENGLKMFDLNFTANGAYVGIALFMSALENDSYLEFEISNFKMVPSTTNDLQATFTVKDVPIDLDLATTTTKTKTTNPLINSGNAQTDENSTSNEDNASNNTTNTTTNDASNNTSTTNTVEE